jgi:hypothetical protein
VQVEGEAEVGGALKRPTGGAKGDLVDEEDGKALALDEMVTIRREQREKKTDKGKRGAKGVEGEETGGEKEHKGNVEGQVNLGREGWN